MRAMDCGVSFCTLDLLTARTFCLLPLVFRATHASSTKLPRPDDQAAHAAKMLATICDPTECQNPEDNELSNNSCASLELNTIMNQHLTFVVAILLTNDIC